ATALVQPLVALQPNQSRARASGNCLGQLGLPGASRTLEEERLAHCVAEEDHSGELLVHEVAGAREGVARVLNGGKEGHGHVFQVGWVRTGQAGTGSLPGERSAEPGGGRSRRLRRASVPRTSSSSMLAVAACCGGDGVNTSSTTWRLM